MRLLTCLLSALLFIACHSPADDASGGFEEAETATAIPYYTIEGTNTLRPYRRTVDVRLSARVSENDLALLAAHIRDVDPDYERVFISYYLPGMEVGGGAWATTHHNPELEVKILGGSAPEARNTAGRATEEGVIQGRWRDNRPYVSGEYLLIEDEGELRIEHRFDQGGQLVHRVVESPSPEGRRFDVQAGGDEFYILTSDGELQLWDSMGKFATFRSEP